MAKNSDRDAAPPWIADNIGFLLAKAGTLSTELFRSRLERLDVRPRHYSVLSVLHLHPEQCTQQFLAGCLEVEPSSVVSVVDDLEDRGLVERRRDPGDRRRNVLVVTERGEELIADAQEIAAELEQDLMAGVPERRRREMRTLLINVLGNATRTQHPEVEAGSAG
ncbi:DNA-binding MarR family transcriptional regulator [Saccharopolyspora erythraea NRRL 2338]|uniref:Transcriptional regulator, MarR family n=2 Tax=Saccharopolyspora erythraea TaxID=1836 RepID=A4FH65_SACEN|nr:MarR family winged helix-turn-helix transcriptional regulator [Saccharopolyspora erythraea]EQD82702.1 MarR family transcriptional regulator [Saccharopolyspora erythraea D]PFG97090.1 DNA-binding MarR family transcriptional regulator [Saccharopolyspora erythraea NRRL 2338]QRK87300.1 winged helix-turn-helix transcriptional regulator [Saccharopolyspora erythraea]CAM03390.1 putative transcriptional regulator, MarR family [Saccharopolyspora erythraea NRRL 2338]